MGVNIGINYQKFLNQWNNGDDFSVDVDVFNTSYLAGNSAEIMQNKIEIELSWTSESTATDIFTVNGNTLTRSGSGDFELDGFKVGDIIDGWELSPVGVVFADRTIMTISASSLTFGGAVVPLTTFTDGIIYGKTPIECLVFNYGLVENNEATNFISKVDGTANMEFYAQGVGYDTGGGVRSTASVLMTAIVGVNSWKDDGQATIEYVTTRNQSDGFAQVFVLKHNFRIFPFYLDGWQTNLTSLNPPFPEFQASNCLKYVFKLDFRDILSNPNGKLFQSFSNVQGNTGWLEENFNGFTNNYTTNSITITDNATGGSLSALDFQKSCHVVMVLGSLTNSLLGDGCRVSFGISYLPTSNDYQQNQNTIGENFMFDYLINTVNDPAISSTIITNYEVHSPTGATITIEFDIAYTTQQQSLLQNQKYMMMTGVSDPALKGAYSDRVMLLSSVEDYLFTTDVYDLMFMDKFVFIPHDFDDTGGIFFGDYKGWVEDGFQIQAPFKLNTDEGAFLTSLTLDIVAFNVTNNQQFTLQSTQFDLSSAIIQLGIQQINLVNSNNFLLNLSSDFKKLELSNNGTGVHGLFNVALYENKVGVRFNFEEWIALLTANTVYFNANQLNNGLNLLSSNYSTTYAFPPASTFELKARLNAQVGDNSGGSTNYQFLSNDLKSYYYDLDEGRDPDWIGDIETYDLNGNLINVIYSNEEVDIKATFTKNPLAPPSDLTGAWGWIRLDVQQGTINTPYELSTINPRLITSPLIPLPNETFCKLTNNGNDVILECRIDNNLIPSGAILSITARVSETNLEVWTWELFNCETSQTEYTSTDLNAYVGTWIMETGTLLCWEVVGVVSGQAETYAWGGTFGTGFDGCITCFNSLKKLENGGQKETEGLIDKQLE